MSQVKFFRNMESVVPATGAAEGLYFNQYGIGLSDGSTTTDVSSVIAFNEDKDRFFRYTATNGGKALFGTAGGHCVHVQHNDFFGWNRNTLSSGCANSSSISSQTYDGTTLYGLRRGLYVLTIFTKDTDITDDSAWTIGYTSVSTFINITFPNFYETSNAHRPAIEDLYTGYPGSGNNDTGYGTEDFNNNAYMSSGAYAFYSLPFSFRGKSVVARIELGTPVNMINTDVDNTTVFPFSNYLLYNNDNDKYTSVPVNLVDATNGSILLQQTTDYMFLDRFEVC